MGVNWMKQAPFSLVRLACIVKHGALKFDVLLLWLDNKTQLIGPVDGSKFFDFSKSHNLLSDLSPTQIPIL